MMAPAGHASASRLKEEKKKKAWLRRRHSPIGDAKLIPPSTPRLKTADWNPRSWTNHISAIEAGTRASIGAIQKPWIARAATRDAKELDAAAQKHVTISPIEVIMYMGRLPTLTARVLHIRLDTAIETIQDPCRPSVNCCNGMPNCAESCVSAAVRRGPIASRSCQPHILEGVLTKW